MVTMRDVAAQAGVSAKTVSRVFNGDPHVLPETRALVEKVMKDLNYVPNVLATNFRTGRSLVLGVAVPDVVDPYFALIVRSVDHVAREHGMSTVVTNLGEDPQEERAAIESLLSRQLSGLVIAPVGTDHSWLERWQQHTNIVFVDRTPIGIDADSFTDDDEEGAYLATRHLMDHGHRRIAYIGDMIHLSTERKRLQGWRRALDAASAADDELVVVHVSDQERTDNALRQLRALPDPPTAIFSSNARCSMMLVRTMRSDPLPMVGFGDFPMADLLDPALSVIDQDPAQLGRLAAERILLRLEEVSDEPTTTNVLAVSLIERASCKLGARPDTHIGKRESSPTGVATVDR